MSEKKVTVNLGLPGGLPVLLFIVFLILKLCGVIAWSWWWVTAPLWLPLAAFAVIALMIVTTGVIVYVVTDGKVSLK